MKQYAIMAGIAFAAIWLSNNVDALKKVTGTGNRFFN